MRLCVILDHLPGMRLVVPLVEALGFPVLPDLLGLSGHEMFPEEAEEMEQDLCLTSSISQGLAFLAWS